MFLIQVGKAAGSALSCFVCRAGFVQLVHAGASVS
jgi:hypothetical protein